MKIRTDFVTNSSSSSFIFKEFNKEAIKKAVDRKLSVPPKDEWEKQYYEWARETVPYMEGKRFCEHPLRDLMEVYSWYREDVIGKWLGIKNREDWEDRQRWHSEIKNALSEKVYVSGGNEKWNAMFVLDIYEDYLSSSSTWQENEKNLEVSFDFLNTQIWEYMQVWEFHDNVLLPFYMNNIEQLLSDTKEFEGKQLSDVMECVFEARYLYFNEMEINYLISEALEEAGICLYSCCHMG